MLTKQKNKYQDIYDKIKFRYECRHSPNCSCSYIMAISGLFSWDFCINQNTSRSIYADSWKDIYLKYKETARHDKERKMLFFKAMAALFGEEPND